MWGRVDTKLTEVLTTIETETPADCINYLHHIIFYHNIKCITYHKDIVLSTEEKW